MKYAGLILLLLLACHTGTAQEVLEPILTNPQLTAKGKNARNAAAAKDNHEDLDRIFLIDTLDLPFYDDFSRDNIKDYDAALADPIATDTVVWAAFRVDGDVVDTIAFSRDPLYQYFVVNGQLDSVELTPIHITYHNAAYPFGIDSVIRVWATSIDTTDSLLMANRFLTNVTTSYIVVTDDPKSRWLGGNVHVNQSFGINVRTIGVATFDGLDSTGYPHDFSTSSTYGEADMLTSKPINLLHQPEDSVILSFWYQPQGHGNIPEPEDSLSLHFWSPATESWHWAWSSAGESVKDFEKVFITITDSIYLLDGFRLRFLNYATLSGALDHWSIDYVRLDASRSVSNDVFEDVGFLANPNSYIDTWTRMPYEHYKAAPGAYMLGSVSVTMRNMSPTAKIVPNYYEVRDSDGNAIFTSAVQNNTSFDPGIDSAQMAVNASPNSFLFPSDPGDRATFTVVNYTDIGILNDDNQENDTIFHEQVFDTYYAYDDGSVEKGYGLVGLASQVAYEFEIPVADTLKAVHFYFPPILENISDENFRIRVWTGTDGPETEVYRSLIKVPIYTNLNQFQRYDITDTTLIVSGKIYVGMEQIGDERIYIGFDENIDNSSRIWFNTLGTWEQTQFTGSLMIRPDFGDEPPPPVGLSELPQAQMPDVSVYPNPTNGLLNVRTKDAPINIRLYDLYGRSLITREAATNATLDLSRYSAGMYLLHLSTLDGRAVTTKRIVRH